jgi:predicted amidophosphoribosyltransferase
MKAWTRVPFGTFGVRCGGCNRTLPPSTPLCELVIAGLARVLVRCEACAGPAPRVVLEPVDYAEIEI